MATASDRVHKIESPLAPGPNDEPALILRSLKIKEHISKPFTYTLDAVSTQFDIDANELLGQSLTVTIRVHERERHFNGIVSQVTSLGRLGNYGHYRIVLRPWFWFLSQTTNCRIFQRESVVQIFEKIAKDTHGFADFRNSTTDSYPDREYCVQYRESAFAFLSRLLEEEGISYYFEQEKDKHTLVLIDSKSGYGKTDSGELGDEIPFRQRGEARIEQEHISLWHVDYKLRSGSFVIDDFDFMKPSVDLESMSQVTRDHDLSDFEVYDYPGRYTRAESDGKRSDDGDRFAKIRIEEIQSRHKLIKGNADHRGLSVGHTFQLTEYPKEAENGEYVILGMEIEVESAEVEQMRSDAENSYEVEFVALASDEPFRPPRRTRKPVVRGPQTAIVVGESGQEIDTDKYGRVRVQFHWDREGQKDENSSCWVRVSQTWAGKAWGGIQIPRIGQEVVVDFLEGDPDRPLITGRVYNDEQMPPYTLPDNKTQSGVKSRSTMDGTTDTFNELRFEDKVDEEEIYFHAEKNFTRVVENDDVLKIGFEKADPGDQTTEINNDQSITIGQNRSAEIQGGDDSIVVQSGNHSISVSAGESTIEAAQKITLKVGASTITVEPASITIKSPQIKIEGDATADLKSAMTTVEGSGMATVKGGLVKIN